MQQVKNRTSAVLQFVLSAIFTIAFATLGIVARKHFDEKATDILGYITLAIILFLLFILLFNIIATPIFKKSKDLGIRKMQDYYLSRREKAREDLPHYVRKITVICRIINVYSALVFTLSLCLAFAIGVGGAPSFVFVLIPMYLLYGLFCRMNIGVQRFDFSEYTDPKDYPSLYKLSHKAAKAHGIDGDIRIILLPDCNAGIAKIDKTYSLQLGAVLLDILSEQELYQVLLHEFSHLTKECNPIEKETRLFNRMSDQEEDSSMSVLLNLMFMFPDTLYGFEYIFYRLTASVAVEETADSAIIKHGDPQIAVNALAKIQFYELFEYEMSDYIEHFYMLETMREDATDMLCTAFRKALTERADFWKKLSLSAIQPRNASHPIFRLRMEALGITDFEIVLPNEQNEYRYECKRAKEQVNRKIYELGCAEYSKQRREVYLAPLKIVEDYRASGKSTTAEEARPIMDAMWALRFHDELEELCDNIISTTENKFATAHAHMVKGALLLYRYDKSGIDHIYRAIDINKNYFHDGLEAIGAFCCRTGLQEELDEYRKRAMDMSQTQHDEYDKAGTLLKNDKIKPESLPPELLESILTYIRGIDDDHIQRIYLVRKVISKTFFTSAFVIEFKPDTEPEDADRIMTKIFNHLDTRPEDWQFSLFGYDIHTAVAVNKVKNSCVYDASRLSK